MMTIYVEKKINGKYRYLASWGIYHDWFRTMKELREYFAEWGTIRIVGKEA